MGRSLGWDRKNRGPASQQVWNDKDPSLLMERGYAILPLCVCLRVSVRNKFLSHLPRSQHLLIADAWNCSIPFALACQMVGFILCFGMLYGGINFCRLPVYLCICAPLYMCITFLSQFLKQVLISGAWNFNTLFVLAWLMVVFIIIRIQSQILFL
jgi:hypothetical protein